MEAPVAWVLILRLAGRAHGEHRHRGERAVVRDLAHDGEARSAIRAVDKGIAKTTVSRIKHLAQAVGANRDVRGDERAYRLASMGGNDLEIAVSIAGQLRGP